METKVKNNALFDLGIEQIIVPNNLKTIVFCIQDSPPILFEYILDPYMAKALFYNDGKLVFKRMPPKMAMTALKQFWLESVKPHIDINLLKTEWHQVFLIWALTILPQKFPEWNTKNWKDTFDKPVATTWSSSGEWPII